MSKTPAWPHHFTKNRGLDPGYWSAWITPTRELSCVCLKGIDFVCVYDFVDYKLELFGVFVFFSLFVLSHQLLFVDSLSITMSTHQEKPLEKPVERPLQHGLPSEPFLGKTGGKCISYFSVLKPE